MSDDKKAPTGNWEDYPEEGSSLGNWEDYPEESSEASNIGASGGWEEQEKSIATLTSEAAADTPEKQAEREYLKTPIDWNDPMSVAKSMSVGPTATSAAKAMLAIPNRVVIQPAFAALDILASTAAQTAGRVGSALNPDLDETVWEAFKNPTILKNSRRESGLPESFDEAYKSAALQGDWRTAKMLLREISPTGHGMDEAIDPKIWQDLRDYDKDKAPSERMGPVLETVARLAVRIGGDPLIGSSFFSAIPKNLKNASSIEDGLRLAKEASYAPTLGYGDAIRKGELAAFQFKLPLTKKPLLNYKGEWAGNMIDAAAPYLESKLLKPFRPLMTLSGYKDHDSFSYAHEIGRAEANAATNRISEVIGNQAWSSDPDVWRLGDAIKRYGNEEAAIKILSRDGTTFAPHQIEAANESIKVHNLVEQEIKDMYRNVGLPPPAYLAATPEEQAKVLKRLGETVDGIPNSAILLDNGTAFNFSFDRGRGFGRKQSDVVALKRAEEKATNGMRSSGLMSKPAFQNEREKLSSELYGEVLAKHYGVDPKDVWGSYQEKIIDDFYEAATYTNDVRFVDSIKGKYGINPANLQEELVNAKFAVKNGTATYRDTKLSRLSETDFVPIDARAFKQKKAFSTIKEEKETVTLFDTSLLYPRDIADRINSVVRTPPSILLAPTAAYIQKNWSKSVLTSFGRVGRQAFENTVKLFSLRVTPKTVLEETAAIFKPDDISIIQNSLPSLTETIWTLGDFYKKGGVGKYSPGMFKDKTLMDAPLRMMDFIKEKVKDSGGSTRFLLAGPNGKLLDPINIANNNVVSRTIRGFGDAADSMARKAYFRQLTKDGYSIDQSLRMVNSHLMDFSRNTNLVRKVRYVSPFGNFLIKNIEAIIPIIAQNPGAANALNPYNGSLKRAIEDHSGWDPGASSKIASINPFMSHPTLMWVLRGSDKLAEDDILKSTVGDWMRFNNEHYIKGMGGDPQAPAFKQSLDSGMQMYLQLPTHITAATDILSLDKLGENLMGPFITGAIIGITGYDPFLQKMGEFNGTVLEDRERIGKFLATVNPAQYPKSYNAIANTLAKYSDSFVKAMQHPMSSTLKDTLRIKLGEDKFKEYKIAESALRQIVDFKSMGLMKISKADVHMAMQQISLLKKYDKSAKKMESEYDLAKMNRSDMWEMTRELRHLAADIKRNNEIFQDYRAQFKKMGGSMSAEALQEIQGNFSLFEGGQEEDPDGKELYDEVPYDTGTAVDPDWQDMPYEDENEVSRDPQSETSFLEIPKYDDYKKATDAAKNIPIMTGIDKFQGASPEGLAQIDFEKDKAVLDNLLKQYPKASDTEIKDMLNQIKFERKSEVEGTIKMMRHDNSRIPASEEGRGPASDPSNEEDFVKKRLKLLYDMDKASSWPISLAQKVYPRDGDKEHKQYYEEDVMRHLNQQFLDLGLADDGPEKTRNRQQIIMERIHKDTEPFLMGPEQRKERFNEYGTPEGRWGIGDLAQNEDSAGRSPAGARAFSEIGSGGGPSLGGGAALGLGAASMLPMIEDEPPPETREVEQQRERVSDVESGLGSRASREMRRLYTMSDEQLAEEPDSEEKDKIIDIKSMEKSNPRYGTYALTKNSKKKLPGYVELPMKSDLEGIDSHLGGPFKAWVRGFAPTPDTFVVIESQRNPNDESGSGTDALKVGVEYARKAGYKYFAVLDAESAAKAQGWSEYAGIPDWAETAYNKMYPKTASKATKDKNPTVGKFGGNIASKSQLSPIFFDTYIKIDAMQKRYDSLVMDKKSDAYYDIKRKIDASHNETANSSDNAWGIYSKWIDYGTEDVEKFFKELKDNGYTSLDLSQSNKMIRDSLEIRKIVDTEEYRELRNHEWMKKGLEHRLKDEYDRIKTLTSEAEEKSRPDYQAIKFKKYLIKEGEE